MVPSIKGMRRRPNAPANDNSGIPSGNGILRQPSLPGAANKNVDF